MSDILSVDLTAVMRGEFDKSDRDDGKLHASSASVPLRHAQLEAAGAPKKPRSFADSMTLQIGTLVHEWLHNAMRSLGVPYMAEVTLDPWMPKGWGGTADAVIWSPEYKAFILVDYKTTKGESLRYRTRSGASEEHITQTSIYWHSLKKMGLPIVKKVAILYIPKNATRSKDEVIEPLLVEFDPIPLRTLQAQMSERKRRVDEYVGGLPKPNPRPLTLDEFLTDTLAPERPREQRVYFDKASGTEVLKLIPHWTSQFCPYPPELCGCSTHGSTIIGRYDERGEYTPRAGFEEIEPVVTPTA